MNKEYICYCGLYCGNCATKAKVTPAAETLYAEMQKAGFEGIIDYFPAGKEFWTFLKHMAENGTCTSCQEGSGNPGCTVRLCAQEKAVEMCTLCSEYPCDHFDAFFQNYPLLKEDNMFLRDKGMDAWAALQDERTKSGFTYSEENT